MVNTSINKNLNRVIVAKNYFDHIARQVIKMRENKSNDLISLTKDNTFLYVTRINNNIEFVEEFRTNSEEIALQEFNKQLGD